MLSLDEFDGVRAHGSAPQGPTARPGALSRRTQRRVFQQHTPRHFPDWIHTVSVKKVGGRCRARHVPVTDAATPAYLVKPGLLTPHAWLSGADGPEHPDQMISHPEEGAFADPRPARSRCATCWPTSVSPHS
jgi:DNA primase